MNEVLFQSAIVFIPGLVWLVVADSLTAGAKNRTTFSVALRAFGYGLVAYFVWFVLYYVYFRVRWSTWPTVLDKVTGVPGVADLRILRLKDIFFASVLSFLLGVFWSMAANRKWFLRAMQWIGVTRKFGEESVWEFTLNLGMAAVEYANVRDFERRLTYSGYIRAFSEGAGTRELLLERAIVYDLDSSKKLFESPLLYLARPPDIVHVEYPYDEAARRPELENTHGGP